MSFLDALNAGLATARKSELARNEVDAVFQSMNSELKAFPWASIAVKRGESQATSMKKVADFLGQDAFVQRESEYTESDALFLNVNASTTGAGTRKRIAKWRQHINGYPCTIGFEGQETICHTAENLEATLQDLLRSATFGRALSEALPESVPRTT